MRLRASNLLPIGCISLTIMRNERDAGAGVQATDSESTRKAKWAAWEQKLFDSSKS